MKLNASNAKIVIVTRSCTIHDQPTTLTRDGTFLKESDNIVILGVPIEAIG